MMTIDGMGVFTPVGLNVPQTMGSLRTGLERFSEIEVFGEDGEPVVASSTPLQRDGLLGTERLIAMGGFALAECAEGHEAEPTPILLCAPEPAEAGTTFPFEHVVSGLARHAGVSIDPSLSRLFPMGHAAIGHALHHARELLSSRRARACYVGATDSLLQLDRLALLMKLERIKNSNTSDGFIPGEAAAFLRVTTAARHAGTYALIHGIGFGTERSTRTSGEPLAAVGMTAAFRAALGDARATIQDVDLVATDLSGERYGFQEMALAMTRLKPRRPNPLPTWSLAESVGEVGAAAGPLALAYLAFMARAGGAPGPRLMFAGGSESGARTAIMLGQVHDGL